MRLPTTPHIAALCALFISAMTAAGAATWPFNPPKDEFSPDALLDLRSLNENVAGESGFVRRSDDGGDFVLGNGKPARFWAINTTVQNTEVENLERHARFLAKRGVNMVRFHGFLQPKGAQSKITDVDEAQVKYCWRLVAEMKKQGIYTTISPYWAFACKIQSPWNVPGPAQRNDAHALLFFDKTLQTGYKAWLRALFARTNTFTGIPLAHDPAVAVIQLQNEDSLLFWTFERVHPVHKKTLGGMFAHWATNKYGSLAKARSAWRGEEANGDAPDEMTLGFLTTWDLTQPQKGGKAVRAADQLRFLGEAMYAFNKEMERYLRDELGCAQLVNAGNWKTADPVLLNDVERWSYTANQVIAVNRYYTGGIHNGERDGYAICRGDRFTERSVMTDPTFLPVSLKQVQGYPMIIPESSWVPPLGYQSEGPFLVAAYQALTGVDAFYWFSTGKAEWQEPATGGIDAIGKWVCATPQLLGMFPANALMYRMGFIKRGEPAVVEHRSLPAMWNRTTPIITEEKSYDPNRDKGTATASSAGRTVVSQLAFLVGPVVASYGGTPQENTVADLAKYVDPKRKTVRSNTGELVMDCANGVCLLNAPKAQGAAGFLGRLGTIRLADVAISCTNDYATVTIVSMDDTPLRASGKILVQVGTQARPTGWDVAPTKIEQADGGETEGFRIIDFGRPPWAIVKADVQLALANPSLNKATALDPNGMAMTNVVSMTLANGTNTVVFPRNALYLVLEGPAAALPAASQAAPGAPAQPDEEPAFE